MYKLWASASAEITWDEEAYVGRHHSNIGYRAVVFAEIEEDEKRGRGVK